MKRVIPIQDIKIDEDDYYKLSQKNCVVIPTDKPSMDNPKYFIDESECDKPKRVGDVIKIKVNDCLREYSIEDITSSSDGNACITIKSL